MAMPDTIELRASLNSLRRVDPYVKNILATATQVALYTFDKNHNQWEKGDKEGALFLYSRNGEPFHSIMIFNRLNKDNFIEPITADFDYQVQLPFLLYRSKNKIFGIWFFNIQECNQVAALIESLMDKDQVDDNGRPIPFDQNGMNVDIFTMLSKAQENFNKTPSKAEGNKTTFTASTPRAPDMASQSVMDFFAKAGTKSASQKPAASGENVLHRLMSNPVHSVEHIEKQQRSITPQEFFNSHLIEQGAPGDRRSVPINFSGGAIRKFEGLEPQSNGLCISSISPPKPAIIASSPLSYQTQNQSVPTVEPTDLLGTSPFQKFLEDAQQKPLLMTPMMFTAPNPDVSSAPADEPSEPVEMLTEKQLAQALIHLLRTSSDFIKQIHEAYTNSILEKVDKSKSGNL